MIGYEDRKKIYDKAIETYGIGSQVLMCVE